MTYRVLILVENSRQYGRGLLKGIARYARLHGSWDFITRPDYYSRPPASGSFEDFKSFLANLDAAKIDGMILRELPQPFMELLSSFNTPSIVMPYLNEFPEKFINRVITDSKAIAEMVAEYYIDKGFRNFAYCGYDNMFWSEKRKRSFINILNKKGYDLFLYSNPDYSDTYKNQDDIEKLAKWLKKLPKPAAMLTCTDDRGLQVLNACRNVEIKVPEEIAIVGVDNDDLVCDLSSVGISSVELATEKAGYQAAEILDKIITNKESKPFTVKVHPKKIITRRSSDISAIEDEEVAAAINFIRDNSRNKICVTDVVNAAACSRRVLEKKFNKLLNKSIAQEIKKFKANKIAELLAETDLSIKQVCQLTGFEDQKHISRYFYREKKITPKKYRQMCQWHFAVVY